MVVDRDDGIRSDFTMQASTAARTGPGFGEVGSGSGAFNAAQRLHHAGKHLAVRCGPPLESLLQAVPLQAVPPITPWPLLLLPDVLQAECCRRCAPCVAPPLPCPFHTNTRPFEHPTSGRRSCRRCAPCSARAAPPLWATHARCARATVRDGGALLGKQQPRRLSCGARSCHPTLHHDCGSQLHPPLPPSALPCLPQHPSRPLQTTDGAACVMLMSRDQAEKRGLPIMACLRSFAAVGVHPSVMGIGPVSVLARGCLHRCIDVLLIGRACSCATAEPAGSACPVPGLCMWRTHCAYCGSDCLAIACHPSPEGCRLRPSPRRWRGLGCPRMMWRCLRWAGTLVPLLLAGYMPFFMFPFLSAVLQCGW